MSKIQCPSCKAVNQDVDPTDPCWQCGTALDRLSNTQPPPETLPIAEARAQEVKKVNDKPAPTPAQSGLTPQVVRPKSAETPNRALVIAILVIVAVALIVAAIYIKGR